MVVPAEQFDALTQLIEDLRPDQVQEQIEPMLGDSVGRGALSGAIARYHMDPTDPEDPMVNLLGSIKEAVEQVEDDQLRANLGAKAAQSVTRGFNDKGFKVNYYESVGLLAGQAGEFVELTESPKEKFRGFLSISRSITSAGQKHAARPDSFRLFEIAAEYLDKAAGTLEESDDSPGSKSFDYRTAAEQAVKNLKASGLGPEEDDGSPQSQLYTRMRNQIMESYKNAFALFESNQDVIVGDERSARDLYGYMSGVVGSAIKQAAEVSSVDPKLYGQILTLVSEEINLLAHNTSPVFNQLGPHQQVHYTADLGAVVAKAVGEQLYDNEHQKPIEKGSSKPRVRLEQQAMTLLRRSRDMTTEQPYSPPTEQDYVPRNGVSGKIIEAAQVWIAKELEFETAKEIAEIALEVAIFEDGYKEDPVDSKAIEVADTIREMAEEVLYAESALKLFGAVYSIESSRSSGEEPPFIMTYTASRWVDDLEARKRRWGTEPVLPEEVIGENLDFIRFAIKHENSMDDLKLLGRVFSHGNDELYQSIQDRIQAVQASEAKRNAPKSQAERLARELIRNL